MRNFTFFACLVFLCQFLISCNATQSIAKIERQRLFIGQPTLFTVHTDATQRLSVIMADSAGHFKTFSENPPDAAISSALGIFGKANVAANSTTTVSAEAKLDFAKSVVELGKKSEAINFQRDGLFRLSEMYNNGALTGAQLLILVDSLQLRTVRMSIANTENEKANTLLEQLKQLNKLFEKVDSTSTKPTTIQILEIIRSL